MDGSYKKQENEENVTFTFNKITLAEIVFRRKSDKNFFHIYKDVVVILFSKTSLSLVVKNKIVRTQTWK